MHIGSEGQKIVLSMATWWQQLLGWQIKTFMNVFRGHAAEFSVLGYENCNIIIPKSSRNYPCLESTCLDLFVKQHAIQNLLIFDAMSYYRHQ